ncbi:MAG: hypothetical protein RBT81_13260 [Gammaproteobacteria bacterium]|jgi:hypothetical protein|nr:hypothetical protein [Gammaproteobacteria bacterium]
MNSLQFKPADGKDQYHLTVILNDEVVDDVSATGRPDRADVRILGTGGQRLLALTISECRAAGLDHIKGRYQCDGLSWPFSWELRQEWIPDDPDAPLSLDRPHHYVGYAHTAEIELEPSRWTGLWSIADFVAAMQRAALGLEPVVAIEHPEHEEGLQNLIFVRFPLAGDGAEGLNDLQDLCGNYLPALEAAAWADLSRTQDNASVIQHFRFPRAVSAACQQYLAYFTQFLSDLGIEADAELQSNAAEILFRVTPKDGPEALGQVRGALDAYLALSSATEASEAGQATDIAVVQLLSNIEHLRSQLRLARAETGLYRAQLEAKDISIQLLRLGSASGPIQSSQPAPEPLFDGLFTLGKLEKAGIGFDWGVLLQKLRRRSPR